ncbi:prepilin peptidase [Grimontia indica]|uniref:prepilin peptidase n=1 Tax=Grimontia indica TaxID=1056512 RepID=UPI00068A2A56
MFILEVLLITSSIVVLLSDISHRRISNKLNLIVCFICLSLAVFSEDYSLQLSQSVLILGVGLVLFLLGILAAGDTKLFSSYALIIDSKYFLLSVVMIGIFGFFTAIIIFLINRYRKSSVRGVPYGVPIVVSCLFWIYLSKLS